MKQINQSEADELRAKAEELLRTKLAKPGMDPVEGNLLKLIHELEVHQIELEIQNNELILANEMVALASQKYIELYDFAPSGYFTLSPEGEIIQLNLTGAKMLGKERSHLINAHFLFHLTTETQPVFIHFLGQIFAGKVQTNCELALSTTGNSPVYIYLTGIANEKGDQCLVNVVDISKRKKAEEELYTSNEFNKSLLQTIPFGMDIVDEMGNILYLSEELKQHFGENAVGNKCWELYRDDKRQCFDCPLYAGINLGETNVYEAGGVLGNRTFEISHTGMIFNGSKAMLEIFIDVTGRKQSEEALIKSEYEFRLLAESMPQIVWITRPDGWNIFFNQQWVVYTGLTMEESYGNGWIKPFHPEDQLRAWEAWQNATNNMVSYSLECRLRRYDGEYKWWLVRGIPVFDEQREVVKWFGTCTDIDELKRAEVELTIAKEHAEESDHLKSAFLANMSHEIRTPMNGILGFAGLLKESKLSGAEQQEYIGIIEKSGQRMLNIINDIISISKIEAGQMNVFLSETNVNEQLDYLNTFFQHEVEAKGMKLAYQKGLPGKLATLRTDREKIYAILTNLLKNAIKFSDSGFIEFGYQMAETQDSEAFLQFYVRDTGIGIPKDKQKVIFERFIQADIGDKRAYQGAGLGLAITKAYVEMLGGKIWVESDEGKGSVFYFTLPYNYEAEEKTAVENAISADTAEDQFKPLRILIAEDDLESAKYLEIILKKISNEVLKADNGTEAVAVCRNNPDIDLILMDIKMPYLDGYDATREIRQFNTDVVIIAQTAYALTGDDEKAKSAGCNDYITKPIKKSQLMMLLQKYFN